ncbi:MAG: tRNA epoxyqueuosine(34) reductase QueG [Planctomycetia bacterium]|nr:MAG: tRNA epoxyqueuosine(34) reductase QueG [Planctomycetia bacterium]
MTPAVHSQIVKRLARSVGFDRVGITHADPLERSAYYREWLAAGRHGSMDYLARRTDLRADPAQLLPGARSVVCVALNYYVPQEGGAQWRHAGVSGLTPVLGAGAQGSAGPAGTENEPSGRVARYARGDDYHQVLHEMLAALIAAMRDEIGTPFDARPCVDTAPIIERELAARAGIGWIGKNTLVLVPRFGSYVFLGELVTSLALEPDAAIPDHCGSCTRCLEACPTSAFPEPYRMDATRCISYLTIEHRGEIDPALAAQLGDWLYGCDVCQEVCPHNSRAPIATHPRVLSQRLPERVPLSQLQNLGSAAYRRLTHGTAARRAGRRKWLRNAAIVRRNLDARCDNSRQSAATGAMPAAAPPRTPPPR